MGLEVFNPRYVDSSTSTELSPSPEYKEVGVQCTVASIQRISNNALSTESPTQLPKTLNDIWSITHDDDSLPFESLAQTGPRDPSSTWNSRIYKPNSIPNIIRQQQSGLTMWFEREDGWTVHTRLERPKGTVSLCSFFHITGTHELLRSFWFPVFPSCSPSNLERSCFANRWRSAGGSPQSAQSLSTLFGRSIPQTRGRLSSFDELHSSW